MNSTDLNEVAERECAETTATHSQQTIAAVSDEILPHQEVSLLKDFNRRRLAKILGAPYSFDVKLEKPNQNFDGQMCLYIRKPGYTYFRPIGSDGNPVPAPDGCEFWAYRVVNHLFGISSPPLKNARYRIDVQNKTLTLLEPFQ